MKAIKSIFLFLLFAGQTASAQETVPLNIGDRLPNIEIKNLVMPGPAPISTQALNQNKMLLINFWATWCPPCIKEMQLLAQEVQKHQGKLEVLCVTYENKSTVEKMLALHPDLQNSGLRILTSDTLFRRLFFHQAIPHNVWMNSDGVIKAITGGDEITTRNIDRFITTGEIEFRLKKEVKFDSKKSPSIPDSLVTYRSIFHGRLPGVELSGNVISHSRLGVPNMKRFYGYNRHRIGLLWSALQMPGGVPRQELYEIHTRDSSKYFWPGTGKSEDEYKGPTRKQWALENTFTYELRVSKPLDDSSFYARVLNDVAFNLKVKASRETRMRDCFIVTGGPTVSEIKPIVTTYRRSVFIKDNKLFISEVPLDFLLEWITMHNVSRADFRVEPYLNRTGITFPISGVLELGPDASLHRNQDHLEHCLTDQMNFKFKREKTLYPIMVIRDK